MPRTMPLIMEAVDALSGVHPAGQVLLTLWCRAPDHALVTIESPAVFAAEAGFAGLRAVDSWRRRMRKLVELGFILTKPGASGDFHYVILLNPHCAMECRQSRFKGIPVSVYNRFIERVMDVGAFGETRRSAVTSRAGSKKPQPQPLRRPHPLPNFTTSPTETAVRRCHAENGRHEAVINQGRIGPCSGG